MRSEQSVEERSTTERETFERFWGRREEPTWMMNLRRQAWRRFAQMSWPTPQEEEWRRTDLSGIDFSRFLPRQSESLGLPPPAGFPEGQPEGRPAAGLLRFRDGACSAAFLSEPLAGRGVVLAPLETAVREHPNRVQDRFLHGIETADNRLIAWHYSLWSHGAFLYVPRFVEVTEPFILDFTENGAEGPMAVFPHVLILLEEGARATVVQRLRGGDNGELLVNAGLDIRVADAAALRYYGLQDLSAESLHFSQAATEVGRDGQLRQFEAVLGGRLAKTRSDCSLTGSGADVKLSGVYLAGGRQHLDIRSVQRHLAPKAASRAYYKGAVMDGSRTIYQGLIEVAPGAAGTDAYLSNKNLILNDGARADSIPSLKIENNDVRCSHGSTTGRIDEEQLFYLMARGLPRAKAREMLVQGYFEELFSDLPDGLGAELGERVRERVTAGARDSDGVPSAASGSR